jgi:toxin-antitoxin system PIN domain toxin
VKIVDLNVLLYAVNSDAPQHEVVRGWWEQAMNGEEPVGLPWVVLLGFLRIATNARIMPRPLDSAAALAKIDAWLAPEHVRIVRETDDHWDRLKALVAGTGTAGNLTTDAHLAALALSHDAVLVSCDADFARFSALRRENPLVPARADRSAPSS